MSADHHPELAALDDIEDLLEAYADARLTPTGPLLRRMRTAVMAQAVATAAARRRSRDTDAVPPSLWSHITVRVPGRAFALGLAAMLTLGTTAAVIAAPPGSPFYNARVAIEAALLPNQVDARLAAHEQHLDARIAEAQAAADRGDGAAIMAALDAYRAEVDAALAEIGDDPGRLAQLEAVLGKHVAVLTALEALVPENASIEHALQASQKAVEKLKEKAAHPGGKPSDHPKATGEPSTDGSGGESGWPSDQEDTSQ